MIYSKSNQRILTELNKVVFGHRQAKIALINLVNRSKMRYHQLYHSITPIDTKDLVKNSNCLLIGPSGTGKTHLVHSLANICEFPLVCIDANNLGPTGSADGFNSARLAQIIKRQATQYLEEDPRHEHYYSKEGVLDQMIIFIDEIDKLASAFDSSGKWNKHVQANFLSLFENNSDFENLSFIFAGAFHTMKMYDSEKSTSIGFASPNETKTKDFDIEQEIIKYGIIPELLGRIHNIVVLDKLREIDYNIILDDLILPSIQTELKAFSITNFTLSDKDREKLIKKAINSDMGVRLLRKEILKLAAELEFDYEWQINEDRLLEHDQSDDNSDNIDDWDSAEDEGNNKNIDEKVKNLKDTIIDNS